MTKGSILSAAVIAAIAGSGGQIAAQQAEDRDERAATRSESAASADATADLEMAERRNELIRDADEAIAQLRRDNETFAELHDASYGHAVFNATKGGLLLTGAGGTGIARPNTEDEVVFMRLGSAGIGLGAGFETYKLVLLFADEEGYGSFITGQWDGSLTAQASAGREGVAASEQFLAGVRAFHLTDGGLMAQVDIAGTRFWPSRRLNQAAEIEARVAAAARTGRTENLAEVDDETDREFAVAAADETQRVAGPAEQPAAAAEPRPEALDELAAEHENIGLFLEAVRTAGLADSLTGDTAYTLFAPTDEAFESLPDWSRAELLAPENRQELVALLRQHIVADDLDREMASNIAEAMTLDGGRVDVAVDDERFTVGDASVVEPDIRSGNLRVHVLDGVLSSSVRVAEADIDVAEQEPVAADTAQDDAIAPAQGQLPEQTDTAPIQGDVEVIPAPIQGDVEVIPAEPAETRESGEPAVPR